MTSGPADTQAKHSLVKPKASLQSEAGTPLLHEPDVIAGRSRAEQAPPVGGDLEKSARRARIDVDLTKGSSSISDSSEQIERLTLTHSIFESKSGSEDAAADFEWTVVSRRRSTRSQQKHPSVASGEAKGKLAARDFQD